MARKLTKLNADEVMFAGIVHDLGRFYLLSRISDFPALLEDTVVLAETINDLAGHATEIVLNELKLPASIVDAVLASKQFSGSMPPASLSDLLFIVILFFLLGVRHAGAFRRFFIDVVQCFAREIFEAVEVVGIIFNT